MSDPLEAELDQLFALPPGEMVAFRNALADRLRKAGDRAGSAKIKALKRPTPAAWALNQVHFAQPALLERARAASEQLRAMHAQARDAQQLASAIDAQRKAIAAVVSAATALCEAAAVPADSAQQRKLYTSVQAWLAGSGDEPPGRMTLDIEASGFDAVAALGLSIARPAAGAQQTGATQSGVTQSSTSGTSDPQRAAGSQHGPGLRLVPDPQPQPPDPLELERAGAFLKDRQQRAREASDETRKHRAVATQARRELEQSQRLIRDAEQALLAMRTQLTERSAALAQLDEAVTTAEQAEHAAEADVATARAALLALGPSR